MIDPYQIATQGVGPGWSPFLMAMQGFGFDIEIIIKPPVQDTGGGPGYGPTVWHDANDYTITVRIKYKSKQWEESRKVSPLMAKSLEKVLVSFRRAKTAIVRVIANINTIMRKEIFVKIRRRNE